MPRRFPTLLALVLLAGVPARSATFDLTSAGISDINAAFAAGALTSEKLTQLYLARIEAYEKNGPKLHALITVNPHALDQARALDAERKAKGPRGPLHGIPVLLKDNIETADLPTTAGFYALRASVPAQDAEQTRRLREAGCVILGKTNLSEFASGAAISTLGGQIHNPHAPDRSPSGSSGGSGAGIAAGFATLALGTDTGGSIRGPAASNGIAALKPTFGLCGRGGIIPLSLSLDTVGPMARNVTDLAYALNVMAGPDGRDAATQAPAGRAAVDYAAGLPAATLRGARLGLLRDFMKQDAGVDAVIETVVAILRNQGAEVVDIKLPGLVLGVNQGMYTAIRFPEFRYQIEAYLASLPDKDLPKTHADIMRLAGQLKEATPDGWVPNPDRLKRYQREAEAGTLADAPYLTALHEGHDLVLKNLQWVMAKEKLDAFIVPTESEPPELIADSAKESPDRVGGWAGHLANITGWPDLIVPAGFTSNPALPVALSFIGPAFSEPKLLALGRAFEVALPARRLPVTTPALPGEKFDY